MKKKHSLILDNEFIQYCELNEITDIDKLAKETFQRGFALLKYGDSPTGETVIETKLKVRNDPPTKISVINEKVGVKPQLISDKIIPVKPLSNPTGLETLNKMNQKEEVVEVKKVNKVNPSPKPKQSVTDSQNDLYDE